RTVVAEEDVQMALSQLEPLVQLIEMGRSRFLYGLDKTPDDCLSWSPGGKAHTPLELAGRLIRFLGFGTHFLRHRTMPDRSAEPPPPPKTRDEAKAALEEAFSQLQSAIEELREEDLQAPVPMPWGGTIPLVVTLWRTPGTIGYFQGQLNYTQLAYGDEDANIPPNWGR